MLEAVECAGLASEAWKTRTYLGLATMEQKRGWRSRDFDRLTVADHGSARTRR